MVKREELIAANSMVCTNCISRAWAATGTAWRCACVGAARQLGSVDVGREQFVALGKALTGGSGWVALAFQRATARSSIMAADHAHALAACPACWRRHVRAPYHLDFGPPPARTSKPSWRTSTGAGVQPLSVAVHGSQRAVRRRDRMKWRCAAADTRRAEIFAQAQTCSARRALGSTPRCRHWLADLPATRLVIGVPALRARSGARHALRLRVRLNARFFAAASVAGRPRPSA